MLQPNERTSTGCTEPNVIFCGFVELKPKHFWTWCVTIEWSSKELTKAPNEGAYLLIFNTIWTGNFTKLWKPYQFLNHFFVCRCLVFFLMYFVVLLFSLSVSLDRSRIHTADWYALAISLSLSLSLSLFSLVFLTCYIRVIYTSPILRSHQPFPSIDALYVEVDCIYL